MEESFCHHNVEWVIVNNQDFEVVTLALLRL
jgi:hypothetical protein